jgi:MTH538 TIR-like domain (DUF1863)
VARSVRRSTEALSIALQQTRARDIMHVIALGGGGRVPDKGDGLTPERFDCFISYARASSTQLAMDLQSGLERFAKPWNRLRAMRVFRDDQSMAANTALWGTIEQGLREARWLVLLATPPAAASRYVNDEVAWWRHNKGAHTLLLVRADGTIEWDEDKAAFKTTSSAIPPALHDAYQQEPRWIDLTWFDEPGSLGKSDPRFQERVADLSSAITGVERDVLIGENVRQHRKTRRLTRAAVSALAVLLVLALSAGAAAFYQRGEALRQRDAAYQQSVLATARQLAATATNLADFDLQSAMLLATTAYKTRPEHQTELALHAAITRTPQLIGFFDFGEPVTFVDAAADMKMIVGGAESGKVYSLDRASRQRTELFDLHAPIGFLAVADDGKTVAATTSTNHDDGRVTSDSALWQDGEVTQLPGQRLMALSPSGHTRVAMPDAGLNPDVLEITSNGRQTSITTPGSTTHWVDLPNDAVVVSMNEYGQYMRAAIDGSNRETTQIPMGVWMFGGNLSPDGNSFTYTNSATDIQVWNLAGPLQPEYEDSPTVGQAADVKLSDLALNVNGTRLATASDGAIYVSDVRPRGQGTGYTTLRGAGKSPHSLHFLSDNIILSASGSSAALWDLSHTTQLAHVTPADVGKSCSACWPPNVAPSPDGKKVVITNDGFGSSFVNTATGLTITHFSYQDVKSHAAAALQAAAATIWLDNDRLFVYSTRGHGWILHGDQLDAVDRSFDLPRGKDVTQLALQYDGSIMATSGGALFRVDPAGVRYALADIAATALAPGGGYAVKIGKPQDGKTAVKVIDTEGFRVIREITVDGKLLNFVANNAGQLALLRAVGTGNKVVNTELLSLDLQHGTVRTVGMLGTAISAEAVVATGDALFAEENGAIAMYSLRDGSELQLLPVRSAKRAWNALGLTGDGATLVIASEPSKAVLRLPITGDAWVSRACKAAGRGLEKSDLDGVVASMNGLVPGCGDRLPS